MNYQKKTRSSEAQKLCDASRHWIFHQVTKRHSRSLEMAPFDRSHTSCYWRSI